MFDRIVGGFAEGIRFGGVQLLMTFPIALLISKVGFGIPRSLKQGLAAFGIAWVSLGAIYVAFYYDSHGPWTAVGLFVVPWSVSMAALLFSGRLFQSPKP